MSVRDSQKSKVFKAETVVRGPVLTSAELEALGTRIVKSAWFNKQTGTWPSPPNPRYQKMLIYTQTTRCEVEIRTFGKDMTVTGRLGPPYRAAIDVHHLIAHALTQDDVRQGRIAWHGPEFCKAMLASVARWEGDDAKKALLAAFRQHKVRSRVYTAEARQAMKDRAGARYALEGLKELHAELSGGADPE